MQISKSDFHQYLSEYTEDEIFYRNIYLQKKEHPETFQEYLHSLDPDYIRDQRLYVPELRQEPWFPYLGENDMFANIPENIITAILRSLPINMIFLRSSVFMTVL